MAENKEQLEKRHVNFSEIEKKSVGDAKVITSDPMPIDVPTNTSSDD